MLKLRAFGNYNTDEESFLTGLECDPKERKTQDQFLEESDINTIVARFGLTGEIPGDFEPPVSGDFVGVDDFHTAMNAVRAAEETFMQLPAALRARFNNDPQRLMEFVENGTNLEEARKLGLVRPPPEVTRDVVQAVDELAAKLTPTTI